MLLDPALTYWVILPILITMVLVGLLRHYISVLMQPSPMSMRAKTLAQSREQQNLVRAINLRNNGVVLMKESYDARVTILSENLKNGAYIDPANPAGSMNGSSNPLDPKALETMLPMLKSQVMMFVPQTLMMSWVNFFFAGFIVMRLPFPLTLRFKAMLQSGVATGDMDVRWVSSLSWYFLNVIGLKSVFGLLLGDDNKASGVNTQQGMLGSTPAAVNGSFNFNQPGIDLRKLYKAEAENLEVSTHEFAIDGVEDRLLATYE
ncbi:transmembrane protein [Nadsonia fulvescens var. elongata DSM 6958]|uniref:ER membrane protein complex subunit 3 n=1 Tax=Nadsonia fulvescens var. elongata DSM 6958 TaxID=857566 RepID=A0A1E3PHG3_9ASCO|nr:transmembrane protein [Nadsonia fulvescens var. elongata DSM 6958]